MEKSQKKNSEVPVKNHVFFVTDHFWLVKPPCLTNTSASLMDFCFMHAAKVHQELIRPQMCPWFNDCFAACIPRKKYPN